jgi:hypothetical protein
MCLDAFQDAAVSAAPALDRQADPLGGQLGGRLTRSAPLLVEEFVHSERRIAFQHVRHRARQFMGEDR